MVLNRLWPPAEAPLTRTTQILHGWHIEHHSRDTRIQSGSSYSLSTALTLADNENAAPVPFWQTGHILNGTQDTQLYTTEIIGLTISGVVLPILVQQPILEHLIIVVRLTIEHAVCIEIQAERAVS